MHNLTTAHKSKFCVLKSHFHHWRLSNTFGTGAVVTVRDLCLHFVGLVSLSHTGTAHWKFLSVSLTISITND